MKAAELKGKIEQTKTEGKLKNQSVEFIMDMKKYFLSHIKASPDTLLIEVTRKDYHQMPWETFLSEISLAGDNLVAQVHCLDNQANKDILDVYVTSDFLEISLGEESAEE
jgi:hypothetical protein